MKPLQALSLAAARRIEVVFTDIDDTLTASGLLEERAFTAMWRLHRAGVAVVPVTGRPAGWCDHIARMWPVAGVIGENGAFYFRLDRHNQRVVRRYADDPSTQSQRRRALLRLERKILRAVPRAAVASDQAFRLHDLAIDFCEDVAPLLPAEVDRIVDIFQSAGAKAKVSSIHVNGWFGAYDKLGMIRRFAKEVLALDLGQRTDNAKATYLGDSPNDEPAFRFFRHSIGVANVREFLGRLEHPPRYVTRARFGRGFFEAAQHILRARAKTS